MVRKNRLLILTVGILVLLNLLTLCMLWMDRHPAGEPPGPAGDGAPPVDAFLKQTLNLTPAQWAAFEPLKQEHRRQMERLTPQLRADKHAFFGLLAQDTVSDAEVQALLARIAARHRAIDSVTYAHFRQVRGLCTPEQRARFGDVAAELPRLLRPGGPPDARRHPEHP